jgi:hypothetical protein
MRRAAAQAQQQQGRPALRLCPRRCLPTTGRGGQRRGRRRRQGYRKLFHGVAREGYNRGQDRSPHECGRRRRLTQNRPRKFHLNPELRQGQSLDLLQPGIDSFWIV